MQSTGLKKEYHYEPRLSEVQPSVLQKSHLQRVPSSRLAPFAGYLMPLWFSSIRAEHAAVRGQAGLFDCTHMGVLELTGPEVLYFLSEVTTNDPTQLAVGSTQYAYILDARGRVLDDVIVYRVSEEECMVVVNAANSDKVTTYLQGLLQNEYIVDVNQPDRGLSYSCSLEKSDLVDIAVQGPAAADLIKTVLGIDTQMTSFTCVSCQWKGRDCVVSTTGYTGSRTAFEIFAPRGSGGELWECLLDMGAGSGLVPCGLGARDSLRIEAGLPLYGHELAGDLDINPFEAGYGWAVKLDKPFFVGQSVMREAKKKQTRQVLRLVLPGGKGVRPIRMHDPIETKGKCIGQVLSSTTVGDQQIALAVVHDQALTTGTEVGVYYLARSDRQVQQGRQQEVILGDSLVADLNAQVAKRFERF